MTKCPMLLLAFCFAAGIFAAYKAPVPIVFSLLACGLCLLLGSISWLQGGSWAVALLACGGFAFAGTSAARLFAYRFPPDHVSHLAARKVNLTRPVLLTGKVITSPLRMPYGVQFDLDAYRIESGSRSYSITGKVRIRVINGRRPATPASSLGLGYGDSITVLTRLERPQDYANPGAFDYRGWLQSVHDTYWQATVENPAQVHKSSGPRPTFFHEVIEGIRQRLLASIDRLYPPWTLEGRDGAVLKAILLGDRSSLDSGTVEGFRQTGLYHLLVVAGLHVGLLAMLAEGLLRVMRIRAAWRASLLLLLLVFYALLVEQRAPTLRATLMIAAYLIARIFDREQPVMNAVGLAALVLLFHRPAWLLDAGFQLSFAAALLIAGLALPVLEMLTEPYRRALRHIGEVGLDRVFAPRLAQFRLDVRSVGEWLGQRWSFLEKRPLLAMRAVTAPMEAGVWLADLFVFSAVIQIGLLLPMAEIFHRVTLAGIGLNILAIPCMTVLLAVAVPTVVLNSIYPALAILPGKLLAFVMRGLFGITELPRLPHWLSYRVPSPPEWVAWGFALSLIAIALALHLSRRVLGLTLPTAALFAVLVSVSPFAARLPHSALEITDLDCGGGRATFIVFPDQTTMLVGACGGGHRRVSGDPLRARRWDPGENIVSPYLWSRGVTRIGVLVVPDAEGDGLSGVAAVLRNFRVKEFWSRPLSSAALSQLLWRRQTRFRPLLPGEVITGYGSSISVLGAAALDPPRRRNGAEPPLVLRISNARGSLLLAGDVGRDEIENVAALMPNVQSEVLQVQGGSSSIDAFTARVQPKVLLVDSAKAGPQSTERSSWSGGLRQRGIRAFNVAADGAVTVQMRSRGFSVHCYRMPAL